MKWKWIAVIALFVVGILAAIVAIDWLTQPIHSVPSFLGGEAHHRGHYRRRGEALIVGAVIVLAVAIYLTIRFRREDAVAEGGSPAAVSDSAPSEPATAEATAAPVEPSPAERSVTETPAESP